MEKFIYTNANNVSFTISSQSEDDEYQLTSSSGLTAMEIIPYTVQGYRQNGYSLTNTQLGTRVISLSFIVFGKTDKEFYNKRRTLVNILNPLLGEGTLVYDNGYTQKAITVQTTSMLDVKTSHSSNLKEFSVELTAYNPLWRDVEENELHINAISGGLTFSFKFGQYGVRFPHMYQVGTALNTGDVEAPIRALFIGGAVNPQLTNNSTGDFIKTLISIQKEDSIEVSTDYGNKNVVVISEDGTRTSANRLVSNASTYFSLPVGESTLGFSTEGGDSVDIYIYWYNWYLSV